MKYAVALAALVLAAGPVGPTQVTLKVDGLKNKETEGKIQAELKKIDGVQEVVVKNGTIVVAVGEEKQFRLVAVNNVLKDFSTDDAPLKVSDKDVGLTGTIDVEINGMDLAPKADWAGALKGVKGVTKVEAPNKEKPNLLRLTIEGAKPISLGDLNAALAKLSDKDEKPGIGDVCWHGPPKKKKGEKG